LRPAEAIKSARVVDIDLGNAAQKRSATNSTRRAAAVLRDLAITALDPPAPPPRGETPMSQQTALVILNKSIAYAAIS
jgi:hypothetical protein